MQQYWKELLLEAIAEVETWEDGFGRYEQGETALVDQQKMAALLHRYSQRLRGNYPFFHPRYAGQMLKPPHPAAVVGYLAAMLINPNNHALDGGPPTAAMEKEVVLQLGAMFGLPETVLGHLTSSGTIANLEALWVARKIHPGRAIACSEEAHYTHARMAEVLGMDLVKVKADSKGKMNLDHLESILKSHSVGTVVFTAGTTGIGAVDPINEALTLREKYGFRIHVDAAYGGFFTLLADDDLTLSAAAAFRAISACDSVVIDPHKHGLQPYGCGCVLFRDPSVGAYYRHDSPYTYFTSDELHLGEISLECSRPGAAAGALWFTLQAIPLKKEVGLGLMLQEGLKATRAWHALLGESDVCAPLYLPELDILTYYPIRDTSSASRIDQHSQMIFDRAMNDSDDPIFVSVLQVDSEHLHRRHPDMKLDQPRARILRSVLMKPAHANYISHLHEGISTYARII